MDTDMPKQPNKALIAIVVVAVLVIVTAAIVFLSNKKDDESFSPTSNTTTTQPSTATTPTTNATYKDGTYTASGSYQSPGGTETVDLTVTLKGNVITDTNLVNHPATRDSQDYQSRFIDGYKSLVVGKKIDTVSLSRVSGSSLTSGGFNQALDKIKSDAKA
jgi:uncharacterized protein with FMN-binding domain